VAKKAKEEFGPEEWYSARLLYECLGPKRYSTDPWFEEKIIVFQAGDRDSVPAKLKALARSMEHEYASADGTVRWVFREILEVQDITTDKGLVDGTEVHFRWWRRPGTRVLKMIRETHEKPWWLDDEQNGE
jgi:hypothetical protein